MASFEVGKKERTASKHILYGNGTALDLNYTRVTAL